MKKNAAFSVQSTLLFIVIPVPRTEKIILQNTFQVLNSTLRRLMQCSSKRRFSRNILFFFIFWMIQLLPHLQHFYHRNIKRQFIFNMSSTDKMLSEDVWFCVPGKRLVFTPQITFQKSLKNYSALYHWECQKSP